MHKVHTANLAKATHLPAYFLLILLLVTPLRVFAQAQLDPSAAFWASKNRNNSLKSEEQLEVILLLDSTVSAESLPSFVQKRTIAGSIVTATVKAQYFNNLLKTYGIKQIAFGRKMLADLDFANEYMRSDLAHNGTNLSQAYKGTGVVVGVIDQGFDYTHPTFRSEDGKRLRIKRVWDQEDEQNKNYPQGYSYGNELKDSASILQMGHDNFKNETHATHTAGTAAGSGYLSVQGEIGMAPDADIVMVSSNLSDGRVVDATNYIMNYAESVGKPCVISMSFGGWGEPMDGTTPLDLALDALSGDGKALFVAMGNEGANRSNIAALIPADSSIKTIVDFSRSASFFATNRPVLDCYAAPNQNFSIKVHLLNFLGEIITSSDWLATASNKVDSVELSFNQQKFKFRYNTYKSYASNNKPRIFIEVTKQVSYYVAVEIQAGNRPSDIRFHASFCNLNNSISNRTLQGFTLGTNKYSTRYPATANTVIAVGAVYGRNSFTTTNNTTYSTTNFVNNGVAAFSSRGPNDAERPKPDVMAVGDIVVSSLSSFDKSIVLRNSRELTVYNNTNYYYGPMSGTSMATPMAAGIGALVMQAYPEINYGQLRHILSTTTFYNNTSTEIGDWDGNGIIDAQAAIAKALTLKNSATPSKYFTISPNPFQGELNITLPNNRAEKLHIECYSSVGTRIFQTDIYADGANTLTGLDFLSDGLYLLKIQTINKSEIIRIVKGK